MKKERHMAILSIIEKNDISTQEELCEKLREYGFDVTQVTVSRDIKELKLLKIPTVSGEMKYGYSTTRIKTDDEKTEKLRNIIIQAVTSNDYSNNIVIIKTIQGMAQGVAYALENLQLNSILGTIAGDDTIMVVARTNKDAKDLSATISEYIR